MGDREIKVVIALLLAFLIFLYGATTAALKIFPYKYIEPVMLAGEGVFGAFKMEEYSAQVRWVQKADNNTGVVFKDAARRQGGAVLYSSTHDTAFRLVDEDGQVLHEWSFKFNDVWDNQDHVISLAPLDDSFFYGRDFHLYENGDLLVMVAAAGVTPWGMGLVMMDKDSNVLWHHTGYPNNDFEIGADGTIYVIEHMVNMGGFETVEMPMIPFLEDHIVQIDPKTGKELGRESLMKAIEDSPFTEFMKQLLNDTEGDPTHSNNLYYVTEDSDTVPWLKRGNLLVSVRNINALVVYNPAENKVVYATGLQARHQHDIDLLENGNLMVFDNQGSFTEGGYSRVIEFDPLTQEIEWMYDPAPGESPMLFESKFFGNQQRLENGNTLIAHSQAGRIIEVTQSGEIVWDYRAPLTRELDGVVKTATITTAEHIAPSRLGFLGKD